ncbi:MAG: hypothetical protein CUN54_09810, partial [Phototrophicales bacterium]
MDNQGSYGKVREAVDIKFGQSKRLQTTKSRGEGHSVKKQQSHDDSDIVLHLDGRHDEHRRELDAKRRATTGRRRTKFDDVRASECSSSDKRMLRVAIKIFDLYMLKRKRLHHSVQHEVEVLNAIPPHANVIQYVRHFELKSRHDPTVNRFG